jgi:predicted DNA-binding transcriptional regulator YafY
VDPQQLTTIAAACRDHERLRFVYRRRDGTTARREVEPHTLVNYGRRWYLVAWDRMRQDWRTFRLDRLERLSDAGARFTPRRLPSKDAATYVADSIRSAPNRFEAVVTLHAAAESISGRVGAQWGSLEPIDGRSCRIRTGDDDLGWLALRIAMIGVDFHVDEPPELVEELRTLSSRLARAIA